MIKVSKLTKEFNGFKALENISFSVDKGRTLLVLGPNGSGKTTLFRCILGLLKYDGSIKVNNYDANVNLKEVRKIIGYIPQTISLPKNMTARQILDFHASLHNKEVDAEDLLKKFGLEEVIDVPINEYSGGMKQRLALALSISHNPEILIFDEPLANLDYVGREIFVKLIKQYKIENKTVLISSHKILDIVIYVDDVLILNEGKSVYYGSIDKLFNEIKTIKVFVKITEPYKFNIEDIPIIKQHNNWVIIETDNIINIIKKIVSKGIRIDNVIIEEPPLDAIIIKLMMKRRDDYND